MKNTPRSKRRSGFITLNMIILEITINSSIIEITNNKLYMPLPNILNEYLGNEPSSSRLQQLYAENLSKMKNGGAFENLLCQSFAVR